MQVITHRGELALLKRYIKEIGKKTVIHERDNWNEGIVVSSVYEKWCIKVLKVRSSSFGLKIFDKMANTEEEFSKYIVSNYSDPKKLSQLVKMQNEEVSRNIRKAELINKMQHLKTIGAYERIGLLFKNEYPDPSEPLKIRELIEDM